MHAEKERAVALNKMVNNFIICNEDYYNRVSCQDIFILVPVLYLCGVQPKAFLN